MNITMNRCRTLVAGMFFSLLMTLSISASAQDDHLQGLPGYVDFGKLNAAYGEPKVMINLGTSLLKLMSAMSQEDKEASELLGSLQGVRINVYSTEGDREPALERLAEIKSWLRSQQWEPIVQVKEDDEDVQIFVKVGGAGVHGLTVMAVNEDEAVFLNILGDIDPARLNDVMNQFDVDLDTENGL
jgi:hypothetical protein